MKMNINPRRMLRKYPAQFWLLFFGMLVSTIGTSMVWPFLTIYIRKTLNVPLTTIAGLITLSSVCSLISSSFVGQLSDRFGRKSIMVFSLLVNGLTFYLFSQAATLTHFAILMAVRGSIIRLYRIAADALVADMLPPEERLEAYSFMRTANNTGIAIGPAIGGFLAATSYQIAFNIATVVLLLFCVTILFALKEPPQHEVETPTEARPREHKLFGPVLRDRRFVSFSAAYVLTRVASILVFSLLAVYAKENHGIPESQYGFLMTINAGMVVLFQLMVTRLTIKHRTFSTLALGALFYGIGVGSIAFGNNFWTFGISIVVMTIGELLVAPTATTTVANLAPADMHGRYMGAFWVLVGIARAIGPMFGGLLNDNISPVSIWYGGGVLALLGAVMFLAMSKGQKRVAKLV
jgi:MFS family permease